MLTMDTAAKKPLERGFVKKTLLTLALLMFMTTAFGETYLPKGTILQVYPRKTVDTATMQEGDIVYFVNPSDVFSVEEKVFPANSIFLGEVYFLKMPILGVNAAFKVRITDVITPLDGKRQRISGEIYYKGNATIGGTLTPPASYNTAVHPTMGWTGPSGVLQYVPSGEYEFGQHTGLTTRDAVFIQLSENYMPE